MNPKVSIILPTWKEAKYIKRSIESVLTQTFYSWELIIIDDGLYNERYKEIKEYIGKDKRIILLRNEENLGIQKTLNKGLKVAKGEYIARIDDDDEWISKDKLQKQVEFLDENHEYVLVGTGVIIVDEKGEELNRYLLPETDLKIRENILNRNCFCHIAIVFRKNTVIDLVGYSEEENTKHIEDYDLWFRLGLVGKFFNIPEFSVSVINRFEGVSSKNTINSSIKIIKLIKKYKNKYPHYYFSLVRSYIRLAIYLIFSRERIYKIKNYFKN